MPRHAASLLSSRLLLPPPLFRLMPAMLIRYLPPRHDMPPRLSLLLDASHDTPPRYAKMPPIRRYEMFHSRRHAASACTRCRPHFIAELLLPPL